MNRPREVCSAGKLWGLDSQFLRKLRGTSKGSFGCAKRLGVY